MKPALDTRFYAFMLLLILAACNGQQQPSTPAPITSVPAWANDVVWYQIFVERFRNGDPSNDPIIENMRHMDSPPDDWAVTPWTQDWYQPDPWFPHAKGDNFHQKVQFRRYGGDLQGVMDQLDYLTKLGVNAIYFNPLNDAPSLHKYDARTYRHIDRNFGPDPKGDAAIIDSEVPHDPATWQWTKADQLFLNIIEEMHKRGMKVIMDYSWNHTGTEFWAVKDIREKGKESPYFNWYETKPGNDPSGKNVEIVGWLGNNYLPVFKKDTIGERRHLGFEGNMHAEALKTHIYAVSRRWLDPNGDGNPADGIDGFRLDVAAEVPLGFWRDYRREVRAVNPEALLIGEVWWDTWPDKLLDPRPYVKGDIFDEVMNYHWYRVARGFFAQAEPKLTASQLVTQLDSLHAGIRKEVNYGMMNISASHDSPRLLTSFGNKNLYKYNANAAPGRDYYIGKPTERTKAEARLLLAHQFTFIGAPQIWNGDELGMWGGDDPDCRKPIIWPDLQFDDESQHLVPGVQRTPDPVMADLDLLAYYQSLIALRHAHPALREGDFKVLRADDASMTLAYSRRTDQEEILAAFNRSDEVQAFELEVSGQTYRPLLGGGTPLAAKDGKISIELEPLEALVWVRE